MALPYLFQIQVVRLVIEPGSIKNRAYRRMLASSIAHHIKSERMIISCALLNSALYSLLKQSTASNLSGLTVGLGSRAYE
jgi:hypothetical protein